LPPLVIAEEEWEAGLDAIREVVGGG